MCDLAFLHDFTDEQQQAICRVESMLLQRRIKHYPSTLSPLATTSDCREESPPRVVASTPIKELA